MIHHQALLDGLFVVVGTAAFLATLDESRHQLVLWHVEFNHGSHLVATLVQHLLQRLSLRDGAGETVEDDALVATAERVVDISQNGNHEFVRNQVTLVNIALGSLSQFRTLFDFIAQHVAGRDVSQTVVLYQ